MARNTEKFTLQIKADTDDALSDIRRLERELKDLQHGDSTVEVKAETDQASTDIEDLLADVDKLDSEQATIELKLAQQDLGRQLQDIIDQVAKVDGTDAEIDVKMAQGDTIIGDLDQIDGKLKELDAAKAEPTVAVDTSQATDGISRVRGEADQSRSVLANMVGNTAQDLGALGGAAGSTGVLIGQLAEYAADGNISLSGLAATAGPMLALAAAVSVVTGTIADQRAEAAAAEQQQQDFGKALDDSANDAVGITQALEGNIDALRHFNVEAGDFGGLVGDYLGQVASKLPLIGGLFQSEGTDIIEILGKVGLTVGDLGRALADPEWGQTTFVDALRAARDQGAITDDQLEAAIALLLKYGTNLQGAAAAQEIFNVNAADANDILDEIVKQADPLGQFTDQWNTLFQDMADGTIDTQAAADAVNFLADNLGKSRTEIEALAKQHLDQQMKDIAAAVKEAATEYDRMTFTTDELAAATEDLQDPLKTMPDTWATLIQDFRDGQFDLEGALGSINALAAATGKEPGDILKIIKDQADAANQAATDAAQATEDLILSMSEAVLAVNQPNVRLDAINEVFDAFNQFSELDTADRLGSIFDAFDAIDQAAQAFPDSIVGIDLVPDSWEEVKNMPEDLKGITAAIGQFAESAQTQMATAFEFGGADAMRQTADDMRTQFEEPFKAMMERNGADIAQQDAAWQDFLTTIGLTPDQVEVQINLAIDQQKLQVLQDIASGVGLSGENQLNFDIAIANQDPQTALDILNAQLAETGKDQEIQFHVNAETGEVETQLVDLGAPIEPTVTPQPEGFRPVQDDLNDMGEPIEPDVTLNSNAPEVQDDIDTATEDRTTQVIVPKSDSLGQMQDLIDHVTRDRTFQITAKADNAGAIANILDNVARHRDAYITAIALTAAAEYELNQTARNRDSYITQHVRTVSAPSASAPKSGPSAAGPTVTAAAAPATTVYAPSVVIKTAVIGDRYDVQRVVTRAVKGATRLAGPRPLIGARS